MAKRGGIPAKGEPMGVQPSKPGYQVFVSHATADKWRKDYRIVPVLCHVTVDAIPDTIKGKKAFQLNEFDQYLKELQERVRK